MDAPAGPQQDVLDVHLPSRPAVLALPAAALRRLWPPVSLLPRAGQAGVLLAPRPPAPKDNPAQLCLPMPKPGYYLTRVIQRA